jgi:RNA polymerase sigma-70 factor (ECF subfamily)
MLQGMGETPENGRETADLRHQSAGMTDDGINGWFVREVLPLEAALMQFLRRSWPNKSDIDDLAQEVYARVYEAAREKPPQPVKPFVFTIARNLLIDRVRHEQVVPIEAVADLETLGVAVDAPGPDRNVMAQDELRRLQSALDKLPPRCREVVVLGRIEGLSGKEISQRLGIGASTVSEHLANGMNALADLLFGDGAEPPGRKP